MRNVDHKKFEKKMAVVCCVTFRRDFLHFTLGGAQSRPCLLSCDSSVKKLQFMSNKVNGGQYSKYFHVKLFDSYLNGSATVILLCLE